MRPFFSVAIPTWEVNGLGAEYLHFSFNRLAQQTFTDFEVVVSDHSVEDGIKEVCDQWSDYLNIVYVRNSEGRGKIAPNLNNALRRCSGEYIKILFQDDFLYDEHSLMHIKDTILADHSNYLASEVKWLLNSCYHTKDGENLFDRMTPFYHHNIHKGHNTISCPSVLTIKNDTETLAFDETYNWLVDCVYYKEMYAKFGPPRVLDEVCVVNRDSQVRTTNMLSEKQKIEEVIRATEKYKVDLSNVTLVAMTSVKIDQHIKALQISCENVRFGKVKLVSHEKPNNLPDGIEYEYAQKMSNIDEWNYSVVYNLGDHIDTDYALLIHEDGFVCNAYAWKDEFLNYDYVGAPWPLPKDDYSFRDINGEIIRVGNSVSLRSKKLLDLPKKLNLKWKPFHGYYNEDGFICVNYRHVFKEHGCKFADIDVAKYFSKENDIPENQDIDTFAFHGKYHPYYRLI